MSELTVEQIKEDAKTEKRRLTIMILMHQNGHDGVFYTQEILENKTLKQLQKIYDKVMHRY